MTEVGATISIHLNSGSVYFIFQSLSNRVLDQITLDQITLDQISLSNYATYNF